MKPTQERASEGGNTRFSGMAGGLIGSEILKIAADVRALSAEGIKVCDLTVGDFSQAEFRVPKLLSEATRDALERGETNYPPSDGVLSLRNAVQRFYERRLGVRYPIESILITGGSRPGIYATYRALVDPGDTVVYPVPSWNNNHYCHLVGARGLRVACRAEDAFLPSRRVLQEALRGARLLALNSPLNPAGTAYRAEALSEICDLVLEENARRGSGERPLFVMYDQVYWMLTFGATRHVHPSGVNAAMEPYTIVIDGMSKAFAATGMRVGWVAGPADIIRRMASIVGHVGAWAPRAEQIASGALLAADESVDSYLSAMRDGLNSRLQELHAGFMALQSDGFAVDAIPPMGAIYLSARFDLIGKRTLEGEVLSTNEAIRRYLLQEAGLAIVPFQAFGALEETGWFRLSVGAVSVASIRDVLPRVREALQKLR
jgi:aspartate aminotransferase